MFRRRHWSYILFLPFRVWSAPEIGYGPLFDPCGENCQTQMVQFCTVGHDVSQMTQCWCSDPEYLTRMDACIQSCDPTVTNRDVQRDQMLRYRKIVCAGSSAGDQGFAKYWKTRFGGEGFVPGATNGIPPPPSSQTVAMTIATIPTSIAVPRNRTENGTRTKTATVASSTSPIILTSSTNVPPQRMSGLTTPQLAAIIAASVLSALLVLLTIIICRSNRHRRIRLLRRRRRPPQRPQRPRLVITPLPQSPPAVITRYPFPPPPNRLTQRFSEITVMEFEPQSALEEVTTTTAISSACSYSSASCESWSERSWAG